MRKNKPAVRFVDVSDVARPGRAAARRSPAELESAARMLQKLGGRLCRGAAVGPSRRAMLDASVKGALRDH